MKISTSSKLLFSIILVLALFSCSPKPITKPLITVDKEGVSVILIKNVDIFNGKDSVLLRNQYVRIHKGDIVEISPEPVKINFEVDDKNYLEIDGSGKTLMPGMIDAHVHLSGSGAVPWKNVKADVEYNLSAYLYAGITTVYDLGGIASSIEKYENKRFPKPQIYHTHIPITVKNSHPIPLTEQMLPWPLKNMVNSISPTIDKPEDAPKLIRKYLKNDVDYVKIICDQIPPGSPEMQFDQLKALIDEIHKNQLKAVVHIGSPENALTAIRAGANVLAHGIWRGALTEEQADEIAASGVPVIYTISGFQNVKEIHSGTFNPSAYDSILVPENVLSPVTGKAGTDVHEQEVMNDFFQDVSDKSVHWKKNFNLLKERNVPVLIGTDSNLPGTYAGSTFYQELEMLTSFGLSNFQVLSSATFGNACLFEEKPAFGWIGQNTRAHLLLLNSNPLQNLNSIKNPEYIIFDSQVIKRVK